MKRVIAVAVAAGCGLAAGCGGDDRTAPRLETTASAVVQPLAVVFDSDNRPLAQLYADTRKRLTRLEATGWQTIPGTENMDVLDLGYAADGSVIFTYDDERPGSALLQLGLGDDLLQVGNRIQPAGATVPFQSPAGSLYVSTVDGGRRLVRGAATWAIARTLTQVVRGSTGTVFGMSAEGVIRMDSRSDETMTVVLPCSAFPAGCVGVTFAGVDGDERMYFAVAGEPALYVLEPGASELSTLALAGVTVLGAVRAAPELIALEAIVVDGDAQHRYLYTRGVGDDRFALVDLAAHPVLAGPQLTVDRAGTIHVADGNWFGTIELP